MKNIIRLHDPVKIIPMAMLITNIGNGMYTLAVSMIMYELTGSTKAFAGVLILESLINFSMQLFASVAVDDGRAKQCAFFADIIRGIAIIIGGICVLNGFLMAIYIGVIAINLMRPFYRTSMFAIGPLIAKEDGLARYSAKNSVAQQAGQLIGAGIAGVIISLFNPGICILINGLTYIFSALCVSSSEITGQSIFFKNNEKKLLNVVNPRVVIVDWYDVLKKVLKQKGIVVLILVCTIDFIAVSYINMIYAPVVSLNNFVKGWVSVWDSLFAIGAIIGAIIFGKHKQLRESGLTIGGAVLLEGLFSMCFVLSSPYLIAIGMLILGVINSFSVANFNYNLQIETSGSIHGRVAGLRQFAISLSSVILVPVLSRCIDKQVLIAATFILLLCVVGATSILIVRSIVKRAQMEETAYNVD